MLNTVKFTLAFAALISLSGCIISVDANDHHSEEDWEVRQEKNERYIRRLDMGISRLSVESDLGEPDFRDTFKRQGDVFEVLFYRTHHQRSDGKTTRDETTPIVFVDGQVVGWGPTAIEKSTASNTQI